jgi:hypothetical protein
MDSAAPAGYNQAYTLRLRTSLIREYAMDFFGSWIFIIVMGALLLLFLIGGPLLIILVIYLVSRSGKKRERSETELE